MCGIIGFNWDDKLLAGKAIRMLKHRGPDDQGVYSDNIVSLAQRRLSIIDLSKKGKQPMIYEHKGRKAIIIFNGEIYNFQEIREELEEKKYKFNSGTDTEVILASYLEWGEDCVNKFNGMWAFCIYDVDKKILFCSRDRMGIKPFYYFFEKGKFIFASEIKAILSFQEVKKAMNLQVLNKYLTMRYCFGEQTIFEGIKRMPQSSNLIFDLNKKKLSIKKYWENNPNKILISNKKVIKNKIISLLKDSIKKRLIADVPLGVFLSGGIDSSTIVALMRESTPDANIKTYSVDFEEGNKVNESVWAKKISNKFNTTHKEFLIGSDSSKILEKLLWHLDEPMADPAIIPLYFLSKHSRNHVKVVLTGDGGDELFGGYDYYKIFNYANFISKIPLAKKLTSTALKFSPQYLLNKIHKDSSDINRNAIIKRVSLLVDSLKNKNYFKAYTSLVGMISEEERKKLVKEQFFENLNSEEFEKYFSLPKIFSNKFLFYDQNVLLPDSYLMKTDRMTMAVGLEARVPMLDYRLAEFSYQIHPRMKIHKGITKHILRKTMQERLPEKLLWRNKHGFRVPVENWINDSLSNHYDSLKKNKQVNQIFNQRELQKIFDNYKKGELFYTRQIWNLLCFQLWYDNVFSNF